MSLNLIADIAKFRREQSWEIRQWSEHIHLNPAVESSILDHLCGVAPTLSVLAEDELKFYAYAEKRELKKYVYGDTTEKVYQRARPQSNAAPAPSLATH